MEGISKVFPGVRALRGVDIEARAGEVLALVGENGAGKSTLVKILAGALRKDGGRIFLDGQEVDIDTPAHARRLGIAIVYQEFNLTRNQTVAANIFIAREPRTGGVGRWLGWVDRGRMETGARQVLSRIRANVSPRARVRDLSVAQQQMVEIAKALAVEAKILIMDEPTAALGENEVEILFEIVRHLKSAGLAVIFITHRLEEVFRVADRVTVLRDGERVGEMRIEEAAPDRLVRMMVGRTLEDIFHKDTSAISAPLLEVRGLTRRGVVRGVSFTLRRGEILGFAGLIGAGRTETARLIFGADPRDAGEVLLAGRPLALRSPADAVKAGIGLVPENRALQGLVLGLPVQENIVLATLDRHNHAGWIDRAGIAATAQDYVRRLTIRTPHLRQRVLFLSGGNQQKVVVAKWLALQPRVLIMDEPTRGIDVGAKAEVHALMSRLAGAGIGIIMISSELPEIMGMSDRIVVMHRGRVAAILDRAEASQELIMAYASGQRPARD
jgi:ABC-type sugar transport system ATPase subunit